MSIIFDQIQNYIQEQPRYNIKRLGYWPSVWQICLTGNFSKWRTSTKKEAIIILPMATEITRAPFQYKAVFPHDDVIKWKHFPRYWPFVRGIHRSPVNSSHKGQWRGALMFSLICVWMNGWVNNREAGDLRRYRAHYDVIVMSYGDFHKDKTVMGPFYLYKIYHSISILASTPPPPPWRHKVPPQKYTLELCCVLLWFVTCKFYRKYERNHMIITVPGKPLWRLCVNRFTWILKEFIT